MSAVSVKTPRTPIETALLGNAKSAMFAAVEVHNKPIFPYRYEVCTLLTINAWELVLKAYIAREAKSVKLIKNDGTAKPFSECVACVSSEIGKPFEPTRYNLEILYEYRNKIAHLYSEDMGVIVLGLLKASVLFFTGFVEEHFGVKLYEEANLNTAADRLYETGVSARLHLQSICIETLLRGGKVISPADKEEFRSAAIAGDR